MSVFTKVKSYLDEHVILKVIAAVIFFEALSLIPRLVMKIFGIEDGESNLFFLVHEFVRKAIPALITAVVFGTTDTMKPRFKGFFPSFLSGIWFCAIIFLAGSSYLLLNIMDGNEFKSVFEIVCFFIFMLLVGFSEELLCRGTLTEMLLRKYGNERKGIWLSAWIGSMIFGLWHFSNIFFGQSLKNTILQVIATCMIGMLLNAIYIRHKNLLALMLIHAFYDFSLMFDYGMIKGNTILDSMETDDSGSTLATILFNATFLVAAFIVLRKKKLNQLLEQDVTPENENNVAEPAM